MTCSSEGRPLRLFFCWPSRLGVLGLSAVAALWTLDTLAPLLA